jgi:aconitate hydratase
MPLNVAQKLITAHLVDGSPRAGTPITLKIDQTLTQDATGTLVMLALEALRLDRVRTEVSVQYVDHNLLQIDNLNADDHLFLESACRRFGIWYSRPGNGISHVVHMQRFGMPGKSLLGSDSHTPAAGALGMLAIGAGGLDVALAMSGEPFPTMMPAILGVQLRGELPDWVSAKDVILEMLRRRGVSGGVGKIIEYFGPGLRCLGAMDRHVIANMGAELGATTTVFPSDEETRHFLQNEGRAADWREIAADAGATYKRMRSTCPTSSRWSLRRRVPATSSKSARSRVRMSIRPISGPRPTPVGATLRSRPKSFAARLFHPTCRSTSIPPRGSFWRR